MIPALLAAILKYYQSDTPLQALLGGTANIDTKIAYALLPPCYPSVTLHLDRDVGTPRAGYDYNGIVDFDSQLAIHIWNKDEGLTIGTGSAAVAYDANSLQMAIDDRVRVLSLNIDKDTTIAAITNLRDLMYTSMPLPFEETTHTHHTSSLLKFTYVMQDTL